MLNRKQFYISLGRNVLQGVIAASLAIGVVPFSVRHINQIIVSINQKRQLTVAAANRSAIAGALHESFKTIGDGDKRIASAFPPAENVAQITTPLENLSKQYSLLPMFQYQKLTAFPNSPANMPFATVSFQMDGKTDLPTLIRYLQEFEKMPYMINIQSLALSATEGKSVQTETALVTHGIMYTKGIIPESDE